METTRRCDACNEESATDDYCATCGAAMLPAEAAVAEAASAAMLAEHRPTSSLTLGGRCQSCTTPYDPGDVYCEVCGTNFVTGEEPPLPPPPKEVALDGDDHSRSIAPDWSALVDADREFFEANQAETPRKLAFPDVVVVREIPLTGEEVIVGRRDESSGFFPDIDLSTPVLDPGVSRRHAVLRRLPSGSWTVTDSDSTNGTWLNSDDTAMPPGTAVVLSDGDRITLGAFTRIVVRRNCESPRQ